MKGFPGQCTCALLVSPAGAHRCRCRCLPYCAASLQEFQEAARCLEFPPVQRDRVANLLLAYKSRWGRVEQGGPAGAGGRVGSCRICQAMPARVRCHGTMLPTSEAPRGAATPTRRNGGGVGKAAEELARGAAREALGPLLDAACTRLGAVVKRAFDIAAEQAQLQRGAGGGAGLGGRGRCGAAGAAERAWWAGVLLQGAPRMCDPAALPSTSR